MFQAKASKERLNVVKSLMACKPKPKASICAFVLEMKGYFDRLESLNMVKEASIMKLHSLLQTGEQGIKKINVPSTSAAHVLIVGHNAKKRKTSHSNWKGKAAKGKSDRGSKRKDKSEIAPTSDPKDQCASTATQRGIGSGLKESRRLKHGEFNLVMGNRKITLVIRIGKYELMLKSRTLKKFKSLPDDISLPIRKTSGRVSKPPQFYYDFHIEEDNISESTLSELDEPANYKEAMASPKATKWKEAIKSEIQSMYDNQVWNLVDTAPGLKTVGCKWIFKKKTYMDGKIHTYKARGVFLEIEMISKEDSWSKIDLKEIQESVDEEPIVNTKTQPEVVTPVEPDNISLPIRRTSGRVTKPP
ncbi:retrotransposon protein, putative, ty1-copia subclass [Tanacetum coccineum]